jgi:hypothetical protein
MEVAGIITGDLVGSREIKAETREKLYKELKTLFQNLEGNGLIKKYEVYRGDSFQCIMTGKEFSLRVALMIRAFIKGWETGVGEEEGEGSEGSNTAKGQLPERQDVRLAIGIGHLDFFNETSLAHSDGEAFWFSGNGLDSLKKAPYRLLVKTNKEEFNQSLEPAILLLDAVLQKWTTNQAQTVGYKLAGFKEEEIAQAFKITQPAVNQRIKASQWFAIEKLLTYFEMNLKDWKE